jgi:chemotaxis protein CheX
MDQEMVVNAVIRAARDVFGTMLGLEIRPGQVYIEQSTPTTGESVVALIGLAGPWIGTGVVSCSPEFACKISSLMLMSDYDAVTGDVLDAMAEMANMIFGNVKTDLEEQLGTLWLSIPTVIFGRNFATKSVGQQSWTVIPVSTDAGVMELKICLSRNHDFQTDARSTRSFAMQSEPN